MSQPITDPVVGQGQGQHPGYWPAWLVSGLALAMIAIQFLWLPLSPEIDFYGLTSEAIICLTPLGGLFVVQHLRHNPRIYWPMMAGLSSLLLSLVTDTLDEVRVQPEMVGILLEDGLAVLGYGLLVLGLVRWIGYNRLILAEIQTLNRGLEQRQQVVAEGYQRLLTVLNGMEAKIYLADMATREILFLNQSAAQDFSQVEGQPCYRVLHGLDAPCPFCINDKLVNADGSPTGVQVREFQNQRDQRWYELRDCALRWTDGRLVCMEIATDITERKHIELRLRQSEERFRLVADHALDNIWTMGPDYRLRYISPSIQSLVGYSMEDYLGLTLDQMLMPDSLAVAMDYFTRLDERRAAGLSVEDFPFRGEIELRTKDGSGIWTEIIVTPLADGDGRLTELAGVTRDIRERKRHERELQLARAAAENANRAKSEFLAQMSHEIRTPLNAVLGLAQVLNREPISANQQDMVGRIQAAGQMLLGIINDVLDLSKIEAGQLRLESRPFALDKLLDKLNGILGQTAQTKGLTLRIEMPAAGLPPLVGDGLRLEQVLFNLTGNAIKFTEEGEVVIRVWLRESGETAVWLRCEVRDTGIGIAARALAGLFEPFSQAEAGISRRYGGTGLGLSISKRLVGLMGGEIGAESQVGQGSTFWFELPFARAAVGAPASLPLPAPKGPLGPRLTGVRVLVVDDNAMNRDLVEWALGQEGATAILAADGQQAVQFLKTRPEAFDVVLMDVQMPVLDGLTATRMIRGELGLTELPVIAFTAGVLEEQLQAVIDAGANDVLPKPVDLEQMAELLLQWLPSPSSPAGVRAADATSAPHPSSPPPVRREPAAPPPLPETGCGKRNEDGQEEFPAIPGIDRVRAARTLGGNRAVFLRLLDGFITDFADAAGRTRQDMARGDRKIAVQRLHTLRGIVGTLGALELMAMAGELEDAIRRGETDLEAGLESLDRQLAALSLASAPWCKAAAPATPPPSFGVPCPGDSVKPQPLQRPPASSGASLRSESDR